MSQSFESAAAEAIANHPTAVSRVSSLWSKLNNDKAIGSVKSWRLFCDSGQLRAPDSLSSLRDRVRSNFLHWRANYVVVLLALIAYCVLTNGRIFLAALAIASLWLYVYRWRTQPLVLRAGSFELPLSARPTLVLCSVATALLLWLASDWDTLVWIFTVEFIVVAVHMLARIPVDENNYDFEAGFDAPASAAGKLPV